MTCLSQHDAFFATQIGAQSRILRMGCECQRPRQEALRLFLISQCAVIRFEQHQHRGLLVRVAAEFARCHSFTSVEQLPDGHGFIGSRRLGNQGTQWTMLDDNPNTSSFQASAGHLYQRHRDGSLWTWNGGSCSGSSCPSWTMIDNNPLNLAYTADGNSLYQLDKDGAIWSWTGISCTGASCPGWTQLDNNPKTIAITAGGGKLYQLHGNY